jgi:hypothetical protein
MEPLKAEGFEDFVGTSLNKFNANQIKEIKVQNMVQFELRSRLQKLRKSVSPANEGHL